MQRKQINDLILQNYPTVEQVGFINPDSAQPQLVMAGGEFCGNATRCTAWEYLRGNPGEISMQVSGVDRKLKAGVLPNGEAFAEMPIYPDVSRVMQDREYPDNFTVYMEGITHYIDTTTSIEGLTSEEIKKLGKAILVKKSLDQIYPASGVMFAKNDGNQITISPVVYVRDIDTLYYETACGSGTTAIGLVAALDKRQSINNLPIVQPSGLPINVSVTYNGKYFLDAYISGPLENLSNGSIETSKDISYVLQSITTSEEIDQLLAQNTLFNLYQEAFGDPPYSEQFTTEEVREIFDDYVKKGALLVAKAKGEIIGFAAAIPAAAFSETNKLFSQTTSFNPDKTWYIADIGVAKSKRQSGIGKQITQRLCDKLESLADTVILRTSINNLVALTMYYNLGFSNIPGITQEVESQRLDGSIQNDTRVFLIKNL